MVQHLRRAIPYISYPIVNWKNFDIFFGESFDIHFWVRRAIPLDGIKIKNYIGKYHSLNFFQHRIEKMWFWCAVPIKKENFSCYSEINSIC